MMDFYENETESIEIDELTIENRTDCIEFYGSLNITKDKQGLVKTKTMIKLLTVLLNKLEAQPLPDQISVNNTKEVSNPFK